MAVQKVAVNEIGQMAVLRLGAHEIPVDILLLREQGRALARLLPPSRSALMQASEVQSLEGVYSLVHGILDAVEKEGA